MKWTNKGHELDKLGEQYMKIKTLYIWGAGKNGKECLDLLVWLQVDKELDIRFVDSDGCKQNVIYLDKPVISPEKMFAMLNDNEVQEVCAVVVTPVADNEKIMHLCEQNRLKNLFNWVVLTHRQQNNFIQHFLSIWLMYKHGNLLSHWMDFVVTTKCNLNCRGCVNFNEYIKDPRDCTFEEFKEHIDTVFSKFDYLYSFHFTGGEPLLCKDFSKMISYISETYGDRIYDLFFITNGTMIPNEELLTILKQAKWWVQIDDYRKTVPLAVEKIPILEKTLTDWQIRFEYVRAEQWYDLEWDTTDHSQFSEAALMQWRDDCDIFLQTFKEGKVYSCCRTCYAETAGIASEAENDFLEIENASKVELLEFRLGYTIKGYVDFCKHCYGVGKNARLIPAAVQVPKKERGEK